MELHRVRHDQVTYRCRHMLLVAETSEILEVWNMALVPFWKKGLSKGAVDGWCCEAWVTVR